MKVINILNIVPNFLNETFLELKKVNWLSRKRVFQFSLYVIMVLVLGTLLILGFDKVFTEIRGLLILQDI